MATQKLGPLEVQCDAPPYNIVKGTRLIGVETPEDVRWLRKSAVLTERFLDRRRPLLAFSERDLERMPCSCGQPIPMLQAYTFQLMSGEEVEYSIAQCKRCHTVYWDYA
jgi:hypothetical protein